MTIFGEEFISKTDKDTAVIKYLWKFIILEAIVIVILAISFLLLKETVQVKVELPAKFLYKHSPVVVAGIESANETYYKLWANFLVENIANFDPDSIEEKMLLIKKTMRPSVLNLQDEKLNEFVISLKSNLIKQSFKTSNTIFLKKVGNDETFKIAKLRVNGIATQNIGKDIAKTKECSYDIEFKYTQGVLNVETFGTNCF